MELTELHNRFKYHPPTEDQTAKYVRIRQLAHDLADILNELCPDSREKSFSVTHLEEMVFWANASIARNS